MEPFSIRFRLTEAEFIKACNAHWSAHHQGTLSNAICGTAAFVLGVALLFFIFWPALILMAAGGILLSMIGLRTFLWRRAFRDAKKYTQDISVVINDDFIHVETAEGKSDLNWNFFTWYLDTTEHVLLYVTKRNFSVIPKSAFQDNERVQTFVDLVKAKLKKIR